MNTRTNTFSGLMMITTAATIALSAGCGGTAAPAVMTGTYSFTTFDGPAGAPTTVNGINNDGAAVGLTTNNGVNANFLRSAAGAFTSVNVGDMAAGMANGVNSEGAIVGVANGASFLLASGDLSVAAPPGATSSIALGINDPGVVVGQFVDASGNTPGYVDDGGTFTTVSPTAKTMVTNLQGINDDGLAIGFYSEDGTHQHGFTYDTKTKTVTVLADPSTSRTKSLGLTLTQFLSVNGSGQAVGYYQTNDGSQFGFLYDVATKAYTFLDAPDAAPVMGVQITQITGIDDAGEIAGFFIDAKGDQHGFVASLSSM